MEGFLKNGIVITWIAPIVTGVVVVIITTIIGRILSVWWKNRSFLRKLERANEKYMNNILPYMIQEIEIDGEILYSIKSAIAIEYQIAEKYLFSNEQIRDQIVLNISNTRFLTEINKSRLINNVIRVFGEIGSNNEAKEETKKINTKLINKKYPFISFLAGLIFSLLIYFINPEKVDDPNSIIQLLLFLGILISLGSVFILWVLILFDKSVEVYIDISSNGIFGSIVYVMETITNSILELFFGKQNNRKYNRNADKKDKDIE